MRSKPTPFTSRQRKLVRRILYSGGRRPRIPEQPVHAPPGIGHQQRHHGLFPKPYCGVALPTQLQPPRRPGEQNVDQAHQNHNRDHHTDTGPARHQQSDEENAQPSQQTSPTRNDHQVTAEPAQ
jgi:hypothetical protein